MMSFVKNSLGTFATLVVTTVLGLAWGIITARTLGPQSVGILAIALLYPMFFFTVGHLTFSIGTIHHIGQKKYPLENFVANSVFVALVMGILLYVVFVITLPFLQGTLYKGVDAKYLCLAFAIVPFYLLMYLLSSVLQGIGRIRDYNIINLVRFCVAIFCLVALVVALKVGVMGAVVAFVAGYLVAAAVAVFYTLRQTKERWRLNFGLLRSTLRDSGKIHIASIATFVYGYAGLMIANYYLDSAMVGYFNVAMICALFLVLIPQAAQVVLYPETSMATEEEAAIASARVCRHAVFWTLISAVIFGLFGKHIILFFVGETFMPSVVPFLVLLPGVVLSTVAQVVAPLWVRKGWFWLMGGSGVALAVVSILLNLLLIPRYGIIGAAIANSLTYLVGFLTVVGIHYFYVNKKVWQLLILQSDDFKVYRHLLVQARWFCHV